MEDIFEKLKNEGQNTVDGMLQWMREGKVNRHADCVMVTKYCGRSMTDCQANIIDSKEITDAKFKENFEGTEQGSDKIGLESFMATLDKMSKDYGFNFEVLAQELSTKASTMEEAFDNLKKAGKNDVDNLVKWMKDSTWPTEEAASPAVDDTVSESFSNIIGAAKDAEDKARKLFEGAANAKNVDLETFKSAVTKLAEEQKKNVDELMTSLSEQGPRLMDALQAGASAFKEALSKETKK